MRRNPLGETAPSEPVVGGCGDPLCAARAWFSLENPDDPAVARPCDTCADVVVALLKDRQLDLYRPTERERRRARRNMSQADREADLARSLRSADASVGGGPL